MTTDRLDRIERRLAILTWQTGLLSALMFAVGTPAVWLLIRVAIKVGAVG